MAEVDLEIGARRYAVACRDGDEARFERLAAIIDAKMKQAADSMGGLTEVRQFLFASLLLADELEETRKNGSPAVSGAAAPADPAIAGVIERIAQRLEALADRADSGVESGRPTP